jgi:hypothetical protein
MVFLPRLTLAGPEIGQLLLLVGREGDATEEHSVRATTAAAERAILLGALRTRWPVRTIGALGAGRGGQRNSERERRRQRSLVHVRFLEE